MLPYGKQTIDVDDIAAVLEAINETMLTTGPTVARFEQAFCQQVNASHAVAVSSGTAALHAAADTLNLEDGDEVIVPAITFVATANAVVYCGGKPVFADVDANSLLMDCDDVERKITARTRAIIAVDYAGQPCDYLRLRQIADRHGLVLIADGCHSLGGSYAGSAVGSLADMTCFSFHPVKAITTCEGGMVSTNDASLALQIREFRSHGIDNTPDQRQRSNRYHYDMQSLGFNYRISDLQCALGLSQLKKLDQFIAQRTEIADRYQDMIDSLPGCDLLQSHADRKSAHHLMVLKLDPHSTSVDRDELFQHLRESGIGVNVHYRPVYQHSWYRETFGVIESCPVADAAWRQIISLPIFPEMPAGEVDRVLNIVRTFMHTMDSQPGVTCEGNGKPATNTGNRISASSMFTA